MTKNSGVPRSKSPVSANEAPRSDSPPMRSSQSPCSPAAQCSRKVMNGNEVQSSVITEKYKVGKVIGDGNFAVVRECVQRSTGQEYALKIIDKAKCSGKVPIQTLSP
ncbi:hypothetical protein cypCar_00044251 [Cyprinus carpio]|nr:hypothetical protein cypCar_00044251 [Cyprinus carpio]